MVVDMFNGLGVYTANSQFEINEEQLRKLKFSEFEIATLKNISMANGKVNVGQLVASGVPERQARHIKYAYDICCGLVTVDDTFALKRHLKKMFSTVYKITINDLPPSTVKEIPRKCVVAGLGKPWNVWNSPKGSMHPVKEIGSENIHIVTKEKPILKYKSSKEEDGVAKILKEGASSLLVSINRKYCRLCNRFIVTASIRKPQNYLYLTEIVCIDGTSIYVYAYEIGYTAKAISTAGAQRVYDHGVLSSEIKPKVMSTASVIYKKVCGVTSILEEGNTGYKLIEPERKEVDLDADEIDE